MRKRKVRRKLEPTSIIDANDRISKLPECLMHSILLLLPPRDAARTRTLSRTWRRFWNSIPVENFNFNYYDFEAQLGEELGIGERRDKFAKFVDESLLKLKHQKLRIERFKLHINFFDGEFDSCIDDWIGLIYKNPIKELDLSFALTSRGNFKWYSLSPTTFLADSLSVLKLAGCMFPKESMFNVSTKFTSLQELSLFDVYITKQRALEFFIACPLLRKCTIRSCTGLLSLHIPNLPKLKRVDVGAFDRIEIEALNVEILCCEMFYEPLELKAIACHNLKELTTSSSMMNQWIQNLLAKFHLLETLDLQCIDSSERLTISSHQLKNLRLQLDHNPEVIEIDAPNLKSYTYSSRTVPYSCSILISSPQVVRLEIEAYDDLDTMWFVNLKKYLGMFNKHEVLTLSITSLTNSFNPMEWIETSDHHLSNLDHLEITKTSSTLNYAALLDGLLWSFHPKTLSVISGQGSSNELIKFLYEIFTNGEGNSLCWWRHLKDVKIKIGRHAGASHSKAVCDEGIFESLSTLKAWQLVTFELIW